MKLVPNVELRRKQLFIQFLSEPGILQLIRDEVKAIKEQSSGDRKYYAPTTSVTQSAKSPRPPKSPLTSPRHSTADSPRISVAASSRQSIDAARNSILAPQLETNLSPRKDDPYIIKTVLEKTISIKDSDSIPSSASIEISDFSSPAFLDISKPKIQPINDQKIQSISLKLAAINISTPNSDNNNSIEVEDLPSRDASKIDNGSHEITNVAEDSKIVNETSIIIDSANVTKNSFGCEEFKDISVSDFSREDQSVISGGISPNPSPIIVPVALTPLDKSKVTLRRKGSRTNLLSDISNNSSATDISLSKSYKDGSMDKHFDKTDMALDKEDDSNIDNDDTDGNVKNNDECEKMAEIKVKQRHIECNSDCDHTIQKINTEEIPQFYPNRASLAVIPANLVLTIQEYFTQIKGKLYLDNSDQLCEKLGLHCYLRTALFTGLGKKLNQYYTCTEFLTAYHAKARFLLKKDAELVAFHLISGFNPYIQKHNLTQIIKDIVMNHSYFEFCRSEFSGGQMLEHYKDTVVSSVLFAGDGWRQGKLTWHQFKKTAFLQSLNEVSNTEDLTRVQHFSYDQFYVIYTRFLYLDLDNDFMLGKEDVLNYDEHRILTDIIVDRKGIFGGNEKGFSESTKLLLNMINRIFETNLSTSSPKGLMSYADFVFFVKSEIDRFHPAAIHYWFNVLDLDMFTELVDTVYPSGFTQLPETDNKTAAQNKMAASSCYSSQKGGGYPKFSLQQLKRCHIFPHLLDAFLNIFKFIDNDETCQSLLYSRDSLQVWNEYLDVTMKRIDLLMDGDGEMESVME